MAANPYQTRKTEWDAMSAEFYEYFIQWLREKGTKVDSVEVYNPKEYSEFADRVKSLPVRYQWQGVYKTVLVPVEILSRDAKEAADRANASADNADRAASEADTARDNANRAAQEADKAREDLEKIKSETLAAKDAANQAADNANQAASETRETNEAVKAEEQKRVSAEIERENAFRKALENFELQSLEDLQAFDSFLNLAKELWNRFIAEYETKQAEINEAEEQRKVNEKLRKEAENLRETNTKNVIDRINDLCDHPPILQGDPLTWWIWDEAGKEYKDTGHTAQYPELHEITEEEFREEWNKASEIQN